MEKIKMQPTRPEDALLTDAFADFLEKCRAKNLSEKTLNIYTVHFKFFREYLSDPDKKASDITEDTLEGFIPTFSESFSWVRFRRSRSSLIRFPSLV